jgi:hypothetical protein
MRPIFPTSVLCLPHRPYFSHLCTVFTPIRPVFPTSVLCRVADPHWFTADPDTDPDPAVFLIADSDPGLMT